jgi:spermidine/putrescine transport system substrate-binding protein
VATMPRSVWAEEEKRLNVYNWDTYIGNTTLETYTERTGVQVQYDLFANNEELLLPS